MLNEGKTNDKILGIRKNCFIQAVFWIALFLFELFHLQNLYSGASILAGGDSYNHLQIGRVGLYPFAWDATVSFGIGSFTITNLLGFQLYSHLLGFLGTSLLQRIIIFSLYFLKFIAFVKLARLLYKKFSFFALFPAVLLVTFNAFGSLNPFSFLQLMFGIYLPLSLYYFIQIIDSQKIAFSQLAKMAIISTFFSTINGNVALSVTAFIPQLLYLLLNVYRIRRNTIISLLIYVSLIFATNLWWMIPFYRYFMTTASAVLNGNTWFKATGAGSLYQNFRFIGQWGWYGGHFLHKYYPFSAYYDSAAIILISFFIIISGFIAVLNKSIKIVNEKHRIFLLCLIILALFLINGARQPLGGLYQFMFDNIPGLKIFREPFTKFSELYVLPLSLSFYIFLVNLEQKVKGMKKIFVFSIILIFVFLVCKPSIMGEHVPSDWNGSARSYRIDIPKYWLEIEDYANKNLKDTRIIATPNSNYGGAWNWPKGFSSADDVAVNFLHNGNNVLRLPLPSGSGSDKILIEYYKNFRKGNAITNKYYGLMGVDYVLQENDIDWRYASVDTLPEKANKLLSSALIKEKEFGYFDSNYLNTIPNEDPDQLIRQSLYDNLLNQPALVLYKIPDKLKTPRIYAPSNLCFIEYTKSPDKYSQFLGNKQYRVGDVFVEDDKIKITTLIESKNNNSSCITIPSGTNVQFTKVNPTLYTVKISNINNAFILQFTEQFDKDWKLRFMEDNQHYINDSFHIKTNGFTNAWIINSSIINGSSELTLAIEFSPQRDLVRNLWILFIIVGVSISILSYLAIRKIFSD